MRHLASTRALRRRERGFSLVEVMVAVTLSLIVLAGVLAVMYSSKVTYAENERVGRLQENGRAAIELMMRDLRGAGFPGCAQPIEGLFELNNLLANPTAVPWNFEESAFGYEGGASAWTPALDAAIFPAATPNNDVLVVRTIPVGAPSMRVTAAVNPAGGTFNVDKSAGETLAIGTPAIISDCGNASVFVVNNFVAGGGDLTAAITIDNSAGPPGTPSNATTNLGAAYMAGARVAPVRSIGYYIAPNPAGTGNSLWRVESNNAPQEMVPGVEALQLQYGVDTDADMTVNAYVNADAVADWSEVISVSVALLARSAVANSPTQDTRTYNLLGTNLGPFPDRFQRSLFTVTVTLRNRTT